MSACRLLEPEDVEALGPLDALESKCECTDGDRRPTKTMPLRKVVHTTNAVSRQLAGVLRGEMVFFTVRCQSCKRLIAVTLNDLLGIP